MVTAVGLCAASTGSGQAGNPEFHFLGFADFNFLTSQGPAPQGFVQGQLALHVSGRITDRLSIFGEGTLTATDAGFRTELERGMLRYDVRDALRLAVGRFHTPVGYWNTAYHHGTWLHASVGRPRMVAFGTVLFPVHFLGAMVEGVVPFRVIGLHYAVGVGNGRGANVARPGDTGDPNDHAAVVASVRLRPASGTGFDIGVAGYLDRIGPAPGPQVAERLVGAHVAWDRGSWQAIGEYLVAHHRDRAVPVWPQATRMYYGQLGWRLPRAGADLMPYARYERVDVAPGDALLGGSEPDYEVVLGGLRFDFAPVAALKAEYRRERLGGGTWTNALAIQLAVAITTVGTGAQH